MNYYEVKVLLTGTMEIEDPHCPTEWMGSGIYTRDCRCSQEVTITLTADSEEAARKKAEAYHYNEPSCEVQFLDEIEVLDIKNIGEADEEWFETDWDNLSYDEYGGSDPDEYHDLMMLRDE